MRLTIPNQLTLLRVFLTPLFIWLMLKDAALEQAMASLVFVIASLTDWYDGWYARKFGVITRVGQFLDPLADKFLVISALIVFAMLDYVIPWMVWVICLRDFIITTNRIYAIYAGRPIITHVIAKWKTAVQMFTIFLILVFVNWRNIMNGDLEPYHAGYLDVLGISMLIVTGLTIVSGSIYVVENRELLFNLVKKIVRL